MVALTANAPTPRLTSERTRYWVIVLLLSTAAFFNYFDRQTVSILKTTLKAEFGMDDALYALLLNAFTFCYAFAYIASGWVVDRVGPRAALTLFMASWSVVTVLGGLAQSFLMLAILRGMLGLTEPALFPVMIRAATVWTEDKGRGVFMSLASLGSSVATVTAVPIIVWLTVHYHWRVAFILPGVCGLVLAVVWWFSYAEPDRPAAPVCVPEAGKAAPALQPPLTWPQLWSHPAVWGIVLCRFISDPVWYFCLFWMPGYLLEHKGVDLKQLGVVGWIPFLAGNLGGLVIAACSDRAGKRYGITGRKRLVMALSVLGPLCALIPGTSSLSVTILLFCIVTIVCSAWLGALAPIIAGIFSVKNVASVWGIAGAMGAIGAMIFNYFIGQVTESIGVDRLFLIMAVLHPAAALTMFFTLRRYR